MERSSFQTLISDYQERQFKYWLMVSSGLLVITIATLAFITTKLMLSYTHVKQESQTLTQETDELKKKLSLSKKFLKRRKLLKQQLQLFDKKLHTPLLIAVSKAIPAATYLTELSFGDQTILKGYAPSMHEITQFITRLIKELTQEVALMQSKPEAGGFVFTLQCTLPK